MDNFDVLTEVISNITDLETLLSMRETCATLRNYIDTNIRTLAIGIGIIQDVIDIQNFIYEYSRVKPTVKRRILSDKKCLTVALLHDDLELIKKYKFTYSRGIPLCKSMEALDLLLSCFDKQVYIVVNIPYINGTSLKDILAKISTSVMADILYRNYIWKYITQDNSPFTGALISKFPELNSFSMISNPIFNHRLSSLVCYSAEEAIEILETMNVTSKELEDLLYTIIECPMIKDTKLASYILGKIDFDYYVGIQIAITVGNYDYALFFSKRSDVYVDSFMTDFSYDPDVISELIIINRTGNHFDRFCSDILCSYIPQGINTKVYDTIRDIYLSSNFSCCVYGKYHPLTKAYMIKYLGVNASQFKYSYSKEKQRKFEYYMETI